MKKLKMVQYITIGLGVVMTLVACPAQKEKPVSEPGPVSETDAHRYNLNESDKVLYSPIDSLGVDSTQDTVK